MLYKTQTKTNKNIRYFTYCNLALVTAFLPVILEASQK